MSSSLLTLGPFSFEGLESPEKIHLKTKQRLVVHHLGSGLSVTDCLGEDCEIASFRGIFSGANAADRIRSVNYLRLQGLPLSLTWSSRALSVIIQEFDLDYSSDRWIPYKLSCYVVRSIGSVAQNLADLVFSSPSIQVGDMLGLLQDTGVTATSNQTEALITLATLNYDVPSSSALGQAHQLVDSITNQLVVLGQTSQESRPASGGLPPGDTLWMSDLVTNTGLRTALILARNRAMNVVVHAESSSQQ